MPFFGMDNGFSGPFFIHKYATVGQNNFFVRALKGYCISEEK